MVLLENAFSLNSGETQPLIAVSKYFELFALSGSGDAKTLGASVLHPGASPRAHANEPPGETFTAVDLILFQMISFINAFMLSFNHLHE